MILNLSNDTKKVINLSNDIFFSGSLAFWYQSFSLDHRYTAAIVEGQ